MGGQSDAIVAGAVERESVDQRPVHPYHSRIGELHREADVDHEIFFQSIREVLDPGET
jgi:hypothetical protein